MASWWEEEDTYDPYYGGIGCPSDMTTLPITVLPPVVTNPWGTVALGFLGGLAAGAVAWLGYLWWIRRVQGTPSKFSVLHNVHNLYYLR